MTEYTYLEQRLLGIIGTAIGMTIGLLGTFAVWGLIDSIQDANQQARELSKLSSQQQAIIKQIKQIDQKIPTRDLILTITKTLSEVKLNQEKIKKYISNKQYSNALELVITTKGQMADIKALTSQFGLLAAEVNNEDSLLLELRKMLAKQIQESKAGG